MSRGLLGLSRFIFAATLIAAPWLFSGRPLPIQEGLSIGLGIAYGLWLLARLTGAPSPSAGWSGITTALTMIWCGFISLTALQLLGPLIPGLPPQHAVVARIAPEFVWPAPEVLAGTQMTAATRTQLARLIGPLVALVLGAQLFGTAAYRRGFWLLLAFNGVALTAFGIAQRLTWNEKLYWIYPLPNPGQPFASFWNRNHAAGYLNLCLAAAVGLLVACVRQSPDEWWPPRSPGERSSLRAALVQLLVIIVPAGVIATLSRGGILSAGLAFAAVVLLCVNTSQFSATRHLMTAIVCGLVLAASLGMWQLAQSRFSGFDLVDAREDGRWRHWRDMVPALQDVWRSGSGLGTYRYVNRPYQNHALPSKYFNADNEYLELAVEGGLPAVILIVLGGGILLFSLSMTRRSEWNDEDEFADLGPVMAFVIIAQGLQAATDYGISIPANALTCAAVLGALTGGWGKVSTSNEVGFASVVPRPPLWTWIPALALAGCAVMSYQQLASAAAADRFVQSLPEWESPEARNWTVFQIDTALAKAEHLLEQRPDDPDLHRSLAGLHLLRYRRELFVQMQDPQKIAKPPAPEFAWTQTHPSVWDVVCRKWVKEGNPAAIDELRNDPLFQKHVPAAYAAFVRAQQLCPFDPLTDLHLVYLSYLCGNGQQDRTHWLRCAARSAPGEPKMLRTLATLTEPVIEDDLAAFCWRRAIELDPEAQDALYREAVHRLSPAYALEHVVAADAPSLLRFAEVVDDPLIRTLAADRLTMLLNNGSVPSQGDTWMQLGRLALLQGLTEQACEHFGKAVQLEPLRWEWRLRYALALEEKGDLAAALEQTTAGLRAAPEQSKLLAAQKRLMNEPTRSQPRVPPQRPRDK